MIPRIGIPVPTSVDLDYNFRAWPMYASAVERSGGEPVRVELGSAAALRHVVADCHGFILPGSPADVDPGAYGEEVDPLTEAADPPREKCDNSLLEHADAFGKPVLGVCFGVQSLNVWRGGSLIQHLTPMPVNHAAGSKVAIAHSALVARDSVLGSLLDPAEATHEGDFLRLAINTSHHQAVAAPGVGLRIVARSPEDGVIEAVEALTKVEGSEPQFVLGVQWHPERSFEISATSRALFGRLVEAATTWAANHSVQTTP